MTILTLIVARAINGVIGRDNKLPWYLPKDLTHFKRLTMGKPIVMGRKTYDSIGHALPGRRNIIVTRNPSLSIDGCDVVNSLGEAKHLCIGAKEMFIIGGAQLYAEAMPYADKLMITEISKVFEGNAYFTEPNLTVWQETTREIHHAPSPNNFDFAYVTYERRQSHLEIS
ncbi:dihydrofolate reductase [Candidatus Pandoraea novymonadis]|uniref:Dihydrofolate reductase n=1 Tax=Candidatus Pandoraea novymonadis TaxID=1808959 RepID=A0ABX5FEF3_9BURK|nr:dihydrofolate reductase [Candidatus Pandoraea novymonadis]PSB92093.1 Dihydrofolate reductase type 3 [Candidatus Pandoraea novymonadis]